MEGSDQTWQDLVRQKQNRSEKIPDSWKLSQAVLRSARLDNPISVLSVPASCGILSRRELHITEAYDAVDLLKQIRNRKFTSYEVTLAFCKRAAVAQQLVCCLTETFFHKALERARELDAYLSREGKPFGSLHGLPISVKDTFNIEGVETTIGYVSFIGKPVEFNSTLISLLQDQGAVLYVKTNIPQTLFAPDSNNNIFGRCLNPHNLTLTAGGSSGGEGALAAMRGSILGVGSDMAGSIRIPAMCNGVFGFKPTEHRIPYEGQARPDKPGLPGPIYPVAGPIGRSARDMAMFMEAVIDAEPARYDFMSLRLPWRPAEIKDPRSLVIGFIRECPSSKIEPVLKNMMETARRRLRAAGHQLLELTDFPQFQSAHDLSYRLFDTDNDETGLKHVSRSGEPMVAATRDLNPTYPGGRINCSLDELWDLNKARLEVMRRWHAVFRDNSLDVLLLPGFKTTAVPHDTMRSSPYMVMWNLYPAGIIPFGQVDPSPASESANRNAHSLELVKHKGAPGHLQLVAPTFRDEELAAAMETVAAVLGFGDGQAEVRNPVLRACL